MDTNIVYRNSYFYKVSKVKFVERFESVKGIDVKSIKTSAIESMILSKPASVTASTYIQGEGFVYPKVQLSFSKVTNADK